MRKILSILLLVVFLFNTAGYFAFYLFVKHQYDQAFTERLDMDEYSGSESIIVKIPVLPYNSAVNFNGYERVGGEFMYDGEIYKMVKQNAVRDTLYIVMVKDQKQTHIKNVITEFAEEQHTSESESTLRIVDSVSKDFVSGKCQLSTQSTGWSLFLSFVIYSNHWTDVDTSLASPPPWSTLA